MYAHHIRHRLFTLAVTAGLAVASMALASSAAQARLNPPAPPLPEPPAERVTLAQARNMPVPIFPKHKFKPTAKEKAEHQPLAKVKPEGLKATVASSGFQLRLRPSGPVAHKANDPEGFCWSWFYPGELCHWPTGANFFGVGSYDFQGWGSVCVGEMEADYRGWFNGPWGWKCQWIGAGEWNLYFFSEYSWGVPAVYNNTGGWIELGNLIWY